MVFGATGLVVLLAACPVTGAVATAAGSAPTPPSASAGSTSATPPTLPSVSLAITDGQSTQTLLSNAIALASVGVDASGLQAGIAATQVKLDKDAIAARQLSAAADQANKRAIVARANAQQAEQGYSSLDSAVKDAVVLLYTTGPSALTVNPAAGDKLAYAADYAATAITPNGILSTRRHDAKAERQALAVASKAQRLADRDAAKAAKALTSQAAQQRRLQAELTSMGAATAAEVAADHAALAAQAGNELVSATALQFTPRAAIPAPLSTNSVGLTWAFAELGKPYVWAATGPNTFDCSGLTQFVWRQAGVAIPRVAAAQDSWSIPVPLSQLLPGDLVFFGRTDIHHVGIYIGDGLMINAPHTGDVVRVSSIWWSDLAGFGRVHAAGTPVPLHQPPTVQQPATPVVVPTAGAVPSQTKPPPGWKPKPGSSTPFKVYPPSSAGSPLPTTTTTTTTTTTVPTSTTTSSVPASTTTTSIVPGSTTTAVSDTTVPSGLLTP
ncbi:MAG TPA: C40 family peptidase [Acidimicrobiales bacterium]|nr:C40 family peptidase [Acidimicrobiales bacterium]